MYIDIDEANDRVNRDDNFLRRGPLTDTKPAQPPAAEDGTSGKGGEGRSREQTSPPTNSAEQVDHVRISHGRRVNGGRTPGPNVPLPLRVLIAAEIKQNGIKAGAALGVSVQTANDISARRNQPEELEEELDKVNNGVKDLALKRLELALEAITPDKLTAGKLRELSAVARDMHAIATDADSKNSGTKVIIYNTVPRPLSDYEVVESKPEDKQVQLPH